MCLEALRDKRMAMNLQISKRRTVRIGTKQAAVPLMYRSLVEGRVDKKTLVAAARIVWVALVVLGAAWIVFRTYGTGLDQEVPALVVLVAAVALVMLGVQKQK